MNLCGVVLFSKSNSNQRFFFSIFIFQVNVDVTLVLRHIIRQVCESLGETYDHLKDSPPPPEHLAVADDDIVEIGEFSVRDDF